MTTRDGTGRAAAAHLGAAPPDPTSGWARVVRVTVLGGASLALAALAHLLAGGRLPDLAVFLPLVLGTGTVAAVLTARRCRLRVLLPVVGTGQLILHLLFETSSAAACAAAGTMPAGHGGPLVCPTGLGAAQVAGAAEQPHSWLMLGGHVLATALTAWLLARGEAALWRLAERFLRAARPLLMPWPRSVPGDPVVGTPLVLTASLHRDDAAPRGPPEWLAVAG